jgi:hypothetical protein
MNPDFPDGLTLGWRRAPVFGAGSKPEPEGCAVVVELDEMWHFLNRHSAPRLSLDDFPAPAAGPSEVSG